MAAGLGRRLLLVAAGLALLWANSPWGDAYHRLWDGTARHVVNDGLMILFFAVVGLELKREVVAGELRDRRHAALPVVAAAGGMVVPAAIYLAINPAGADARGWGIPMATDIAFAMGALALVGSRLPASLRLFVLALAVVDDIGAVVILSLFYAGDVGWHALPLVGAAVAMAVPAPGMVERVERALAPWVNVVVVPLFAFANGGVALSASAVGEAARSPVTWGVVLGLVVGKPAGIALFAWLAHRMGMARMPPGVSWRQFVGAAALCGIGFTVSLFVTGLAFERSDLVEEAKIGIVTASVLATIVAAAVLRRSTRA